MKNKTDKNILVSAKRDSGDTTEAISIPYVGII